MRTPIRVETFEEFFIRLVIYSKFYIFFSIRVVHTGLLHFELQVMRKKKL